MCTSTYLSPGDCGGLVWGQVQPVSIGKGGKVNLSAVSNSALPLPADDGTIPSSSAGGLVRAGWGSFKESNNPSLHGDIAIGQRRLMRIGMTGVRL